MGIFIPNSDGGFQKSPNIIVKKAESDMRAVRDRLKQKLGTLAYQTRINPLKVVIRRQMAKDAAGAVETVRWFTEAMRRKKKLHPAMHAALVAAAYELIEEKAG